MRRRSSMLSSCFFGRISLVLCWISSFTATAQSLESPDDVSQCWEPCVSSPPNANVPVPGTNCMVFYVCREGRLTNTLACTGGRAFDMSIGACNHIDLVTCIGKRFNGQNILHTVSWDPDFIRIYCTILLTYWKTQHAVQRYHRLGNLQFLRRNHLQMHQQVRSDRRMNFEFYCRLYGWYCLTQSILAHDKYHRCAIR